MRTTVDIDDPILKEVKALKRKEKLSLGRIVSDLLALGLKARVSARGKPRPPRWISRTMTARVDLADKDALWAALEPKAPARKSARG
jgi:hypothetical protein